MEHLAFFQLAHDPFRNDPELDLWFRGTPQRSALRRLVRLARQGKELSLLVGGSGVGKTTLLRSFFEDLDPSAFEPALLVVSRGVEPEWLRRSLAAQLGVETPADDRAEGMRQLYQRVAEIHGEQRRVLVLLDEAHALGADGLAELRSWMNLESEERKVLSFLLVGNEELVPTLRAHGGLLERVEAQVELTGFSQEESREYLEHRLKRVGGHAGIFEDDAYALIADLAEGRPRHLNALADNTLFEAYLAGRTPANADDVRSAARDLPWAQGSTPGEIAEELGDLGGDSLDYVAEAFGPVAKRSADSLGVSDTNPELDEDGGHDDEGAGGLFDLDDSISSALAELDEKVGPDLGHDPDAPREIHIDEEPSVGALREEDLDAAPASDFIESDILTPVPEPAPEDETPAREQGLQSDPPAAAQSVVPDDDEIEGLFENLLQDD